VSYRDLAERLRATATDLAGLNMAIMNVNEFLIFDYEALDEVLESVERRVIELRRVAERLKRTTWTGTSVPSEKKP